MSSSSQRSLHSFLSLFRLRLSLSLSVFLHAVPQQQNASPDQPRLALGGLGGHKAGARRTRRVNTYKT
ncbi:unnamed protein product [Prunus armeniaca]